MSEQTGLSAGEFGAAFKGFLEQAVRDADAPEPVFARLIRAHFGAELAELPIIAQEFEGADHANVQVAIDAFTTREGRAAELLGIGAAAAWMPGARLADLINPPSMGMLGGDGPKVGPVAYTTVTLDEDHTVTCVQTGLYLIRDGERRLVLYLRGPVEQGFRQGVQLEVMATSRADAEACLAELRTLVRDRNVYRGHVLALGAGDSLPMSGLTIRFQRLPDIARDGVILPEATLERAEAHTLGIARQRDRLLAAGRHLKRGLLLYGPPGTGKTLTAMYLIAQMPERTTLLLTGRTQGLIPKACAMARLLQPSMVVLEDVDLVAEERTRGSGCGPLLFELLNEMDGLADDADVIFLLTTNRPELLEPALAARPGRIDQAILVPLPDADCRDRLLDLYGRGLRLQLADRAAAIARTEGVSAAFIKELLRKAAQHAADTTGGDPLTVTDGHLNRALHDLLVEGGTLTRSLLGATVTTGPTPAGWTAGDAAP